MGAYFRQKQRQMPFEELANKLPEIEEKENNNAASITTSNYTTAAKQYAEMDNKSGSNFSGGSGGGVITVTAKDVSKQRQNSLPSNCDRTPRGNAGRSPRG